MEDFIKLIDDLNQELYDTFGDTNSYERQFNYSTDGYAHIINFGEILIYCSEDSERIWDEVKKDYEPLKPFIKRMLRNEIKKISKVKKML